MSDGVTRRDGSDGTRRDGSGAEPTGGDRGWRLPPGLVARFSAVRQLPTRGAEADVFVVGLAGGGEAILKLYRYGDSLADRALDVISGIDHEHVVGILDWGEVDGRWFELQEYCPLGSLADLSDAGSLPLLEVVAELSAALAALHGAGVVHQDLKPGNVLVRTRTPLDLVVCDFGVTKALEGSRRWSTGAGTAEYSPPEAGAGEVSPAWDWWSLGMMIAELAIGRHPLALPDGSMPSFHVIRSHLAQRDVDVSAITDARVRLLCEGLLTRDSSTRWGADQVTAWLAGATPDVVRGEVGEGATGVRGRARVRFGGSEFDSPAGVAAAFAGSWQAAGSALFAERDRTLRDDLTAMLREHSLFSAISTLEAQRSGRPDNALARLLLDMDPMLVPQIDGVSVTPAGVEQVGVAVLHAGAADDVQARVCSLVVEADLLRVWRHLPGMDGAGEAGDRVEAITTELKALGEQFISNTAVASKWEAKTRWAQAGAVLQAWTVLLAVNPKAHEAALAEALAGCDRGAVTEQAWWNTYAGASGSPAAALRALVTYPIAAADQTAQHAQRAAQQAAQQAAAEAAADAERERSRRAAQIRQEADRARWVRVRNSLIRWLVVLVVLGAAVLLIARSCSSTVSSSSGSPVDRAAVDARDKQINKMEALEDSVERNCPSTEVVGSPDQYFQDDWHWQVLPTKDCRGVVGYLDGNQAWIRRGMFPRVESVGHVISVDSAVTVVSMLDSGAIYPPQPDLFVAGPDDIDWQRTLEMVVSQWL